MATAQRKQYVPIFVGSTFEDLQDKRHTVHVTTSRFASGATGNASEARQLLPKPAG